MKTPPNELCDCSKMKSCAKKWDAKHAKPCARNLCSPAMSRSISISSARSIRATPRTNFRFSKPPGALSLTTLISFLLLLFGLNVTPQRACHALETGCAPRVVQRSAVYNFVHKWPAQRTNHAQDREFSAEAQFRCGLADKSTSK